MKKIIMSFLLVIGSAQAKIPVPVAINQSLSSLAVLVQVKWLGFWKKISNRDIAQSPRNSVAQSQVKRSGGDVLLIQNRQYRNRGFVVAVADAYSRMWSLAHVQPLVQPYVTCEEVEQVGQNFASLSDCTDAGTIFIKPIWPTIMHAFRTGELNVDMCGQSVENQDSATNAGVTGVDSKICGAAMVQNNIKGMFARVTNNFGVADEKLKAQLHAQREKTKFWKGAAFGGAATVWLFTRNRNTEATR